MSTAVNCQDTAVLLEVVHWSVSLQIATQMICSRLCNVHTFKGLLHDRLQCYVEIVLSLGKYRMYKSFF
jgi:hypothetical protein